MATSGSANWNLTRDDILKEAGQMVGAVGEDENLSPEQIVSFSRTLNSMIKYWQTKGTFLWTVDWTIQTFDSANTQIEVSSNLYTALLPHTSVTADNKPGSGTDWKLYWRDDSSGSGTAWSNGQSYTSLFSFEVASDTIDIEQAFYRDSNDNDHDIEIVPFRDFLTISDKDSTGSISIMALERRLTPRVHVWQAPSDTDDVLHYLRVRKLEDFDASANEPDFPDRWIRPITLGLAYDLTYKHPIPINEKMALKRDFMEAFLEAKGEDSETLDYDYVAPSF